VAEYERVTVKQRLATFVVRHAARFANSSIAPSKLAELMKHAFAVALGDLHRPDAQQLAQNKSWLYAANRQIAGRAVRIDAELYRVQQTETAPPTETQVYAHPFLNLLRQPNRDNSGKVFHWRTVLHLNTGGRAYVLCQPEVLKMKFANVDTTLTRIKSMRLLDPDRVYPISIPDDGDGDCDEFREAALFRYMPITGRQRTYIAAPADWAEREAWKRNPTPFVVRIMLPAADSWHGQGPTDAGAWALKTMYALGNMWSRQLENGLHAGLVLMMKTAGLDDAERFEKAIAMVKTGIGKAGEPWVLPAKLVDIHDTPTSMADQQFPLLGVSTRQEALAVAGSSEGMVGLADSYTRATIDGTERIMALGTVDPINVLIADAYNTFVLPLMPGQSDMTKMVLRYRTVAAMDELVQATRLTTLVTGTIMTPNEARKELGLPYHKDGGDLEKALQLVPMPPKAGAPGAGAATTAPAADPADAGSAGASGNGKGTAAGAKGE
jgi:phage portal protein BeeE